MSAEREGELLALLDTIADPCSLAHGKPVGLVALGVVDRVEVARGEAMVAIMPTIPGCLFIGVIEEKIERLADALPWCTGLRVTIADGLWDPSRMTARGDQSSIPAALSD
jgi:metal-sulfur cluster biosynthetic enzyme